MEGLVNRVLTIALLFSLSASHACAGGGLRWTDDVKKELAAEGKVIAHLVSWGNRIYIAATPEQIAKCPEWDQVADPPVTLAEAVEAARSRVQKDNPEFGRLELDRVRLEQGHSGRWIYTVQLEGKVPRDGDQTDRAEFLVGVMMDGTVLERQFGPVPGRKPEPPLGGIPDLTRTPSEFPVPEAQRHAIERRMAAIIIPEVDFRQANLIDVVQFLDCMVSEHGGEIEKNDDTRVRVRMGEFFTTEDHRARLPPHATWWTGTPDMPLLTFAAHDVSLLETLGIMVSVGGLDYTIHGRVVSINDPKKRAGSDASPHALCFCAQSLRLDPLLTAKRCTSD